jgi:hypothetical protein
MNPHACLARLVALALAAACTSQATKDSAPSPSLTPSGGAEPAASSAGTSPTATPAAPNSSLPGPAAGGALNTPAGTGGAPPALSGSGGAPAGPVATSPSSGGAPAVPGNAGAPGTAGAPVSEDTPPTLIGDVTFSVPSGTFEGELAVSMMSTVGEIRYTTDGTLPASTSTLYDGASLTLTETTQLRAQAFDGDVAAGLVSTAIYIRRTFDVTSDIPIVIMEGYGGGKPPTEAGAEKVVFRDLAFMLFEPVDGVAAISAPPTWASRAGYHVRGQSSANFEKTPYRVELWDNQNEDADYPMIGMPADSDWAMVGPYTDKTLIRNAFIYSLAPEVGLHALEIRFAEVYLNQDASPLEPEDYFGVYAVTETVKNMKGRVDLKQLDPTDTTEPDISGGYIFKFDQAAVREDEGELEIFCTPSAVSADGGNDCYTDLELTDPVEPNAEQIAYIQAYIQQLHDALHAEPIGNYAEFMNVESFVDQFLLNELTKGGDKYTRSVYLHKDRDGLVTAGPVWDYNFTMGNYTRELEGWQLAPSPSASNDWFQILFAQPDFMVAAGARWRELRMGVLSDAEIEARIALVSAPLVNAGPRDLERWPVGEGTGFGSQVDEDAPTTWEGQVEALVQWLRERTVWLDEQFVAP